MPCTRCRAGSAGRRSWPWLAGFALAYLYYIAGAVAAGAHGARRSSRSTCSCSTSGTSTSSTTGSSCGRRSGSGACCGSAATARIIDGLGPDGIAARVLWTTGRVVRLQTGYVYHYAFAMLIGVALIVTWLHVLRRSRGDDHDRLRHPLRSSPSCRWSARCSSPRSNKEAQGQRALDRALHHARHVRRLAATCGRTSTRPTPASSSSRRWTGSAAPSTTRWASTASRCCSWC